MNDAILIFACPCFHFCLAAKDVVVAPFSFIIKGVKETLEWFQ